MNNITEGLYPEVVFKNFEKISQIPRPSGHEKEVSDFILNFSQSLGFESFQDEYHNVIVKKPATNGKENSSTVMLQAHIDMVPEAADHKEHDFEKDPIELVVDGNKLKANQTTLGADNGIGVAYMLSLIESSDISHPNLELVFTADEEMGLIGVNKMDLSSSDSSYVINLDSEEEDSILVGCAGAVNATISVRKEYKPAIPGNVALEINVKGLFGGHSGMDIDKKRGNANLIMGRILNSITHEYDLFNISGGSKRNAIPRNCEAVISINNAEIDDIVRGIQKQSAKIQKEYYPIEPKLKIELRRSAPTEFKVFTDACKDKIVRLMHLLPNGVISMDNNLVNTVETSSNFALVKETYNKIEFVSLIRSSSQSKKEYLKSIVSLLADTFGAEIHFDSEYSAWEYKASSNLEKLASSVYKEVFGVDPKILVMHCGLECGILLEKLPTSAEAISIGPNMYDVHTPEEYVEIDSIGKMWDYLLELLKAL